MVFPSSLCLATVVSMVARNVVAVKVEVQVLPVADDILTKKRQE